MKIGREKCRMKNRGFVTYALACDATRALVHRKNFKEFFTLTAADSWLQPDYVKSVENIFINPSIIQNSSKLLTTLNDDCLLHIMSFLDPLDVFTLKKVCWKFFELSEFYFRTIKSLNFMEIKGKKKLTLLEAKIVSDKIGKNIKNLTVNSDKFNNQRILNFIPKYFRNVKVLKLIGFKLENVNFWQQMKKILLNLEILDLSDNSLIDESFLNCFINNDKKLKALNVSNSNVYGDFLEKVQFIESLNISECRNINGRQLIPYLKANENLKALNLGKCPNVYGRALNEMLTHALHLKSLTLNNYYIDEDTSRFIIPNINSMQNLEELCIQNINYPPCDQLLRTINLKNSIETLNISYGNMTLTTVYAISTMKYLKKLIMNFKTSVSDDLIEYLTDKEKLEEIHIAGCSYLSPENVLRLIEIKTLKFLDISRCYGFTNEFIIEASKILKSSQPRDRFLMHVGQTEIEPSVYEENELANDCRKYLTLKWTTTKDLEHDYDIDEENNRTEQQINECFNIEGEKNIF